MPPAITAAAGLVDSWQMAIKTEQSNTGTSLPANYADVETSKAPPLTDGLKITTARPQSANNKMSITGNLDGIAVTGASYYFELSNSNPIPT